METTTLEPPNIGPAAVLGGAPSASSNSELAGPPEPASLTETGLVAAEIEALLLKHLLHGGVATGMQIASDLCLPRTVVVELLNQLRAELLVAIKGNSGLSDFVFQLTDAGHARAKQHVSRANYVGPAPVPLSYYTRSLEHQSCRRLGVSLPRLRTALRDLQLDPALVSRLAQALNDARGLFLFGHPGNGKTSIAERLGKSFGQYLWIPQIVSVGADLVRLYDPVVHRRVEHPQLNLQRYDRRWVLIERPTVVMGGELTLDHLDARFNSTVGIHEAPAQMKAGGGVLVIDDFGRQRASSSEILNRLIVPLEKGFDFLNLASGRQIQAPFDLLFVLSTNLQPRELVDEAFLRRIPYKIEVGDPTEADLAALVLQLANSGGYAVEAGAIEYLLEAHYRRANREPRYCHARDLLRQVRNYCQVHELPLALNPATVDEAVANYFAL